ncbi:DUF2187 domain-containing protein [Enterococcus sp. JM4C]|uniref:DUF2187 domain-containing protein n=1 Tax=Candidatus Enterococcus huntleyi TaxID=1857217 RepID=UPI00137AB0CF|nr:DUF2187 domain-containing protein [Enterococcus sp. JM4C]KAF1297713.1 DUF2187 domain-containing protein [Enterococcus sp. JM4C]
MNNQETVFFIWEDEEYEGVVEKEYEYSFLISVHNPTDDMVAKYTNRMIVSKKVCRVTK